MSKSIYEEALEELKDATTDLKDLEIIHSYDVSKIEKALSQAQEQEKLLELYKEINNKRKELMTLARHNTWSWKLECEITILKTKIKELENEKND